LVERTLRFQAKTEGQREQKGNKFFHNVMYFKLLLFGCKSKKNSKL
jgi:hypothetical protein